MDLEYESFFGNEAEYFSFQRVPRRLSCGLSLNPQKCQFLMNRGRLQRQDKKPSVQDEEGIREGDLDVCECERSEVLPMNHHYEKCEGFVSGVRRGPRSPVLKSIYP